MERMAVARKRGKALCVGTSFRRRQRRSGVVSSCRDEVVGGKEDTARRYTIHSPESASFIPLSLSFVPFLSFYECLSVFLFGFSYVLNLDVILLQFILAVV